MDNDVDKVDLVQIVCMPFGSHPIYLQGNLDHVLKNSYPNFQLQFLETYKDVPVVHHLSQIDWVHGDLLEQVTHTLYVESQQLVHYLAHYPYEHHA